MKSLAHHLLGQTRSAVLGTLLLRPEASLHVRELARITGSSPGSLHRELAALSALGVLKRETIGRQVHYSADRDAPVYAELAGLLRKTAGLADVLRAALAPLAESITLAFVFGSMASGTARSGSDVDVMVLGEAGFAALAVALAPTQEMLAREVNFVPMRPAEFAAKLHAGDGFARTVMDRAKIWLIGSDHDLAELVENRSTPDARPDARGSAAPARSRRAKPR